ncbi:hypothetical protein VTJ04DRAFT_1951 [Mycothermus thermophilus]|uniref:uncharacterized protein n=1 Tax=Humicola insolens TaxID=85995 RepID=UPI003742D509
MCRYRVFLWKCDHAVAERPRELYETCPNKPRNGQPCPYVDRAKDIKYRDPDLCPMSLDQSYTSQWTFGFPVFPNFQDL